MNNHMIFIVIPRDRFAKTRMRLAKDSGKKEVLNAKLPVFYTDDNSKVIFTNIDRANEYAESKGRIARFIEWRRK